MEPSHNIQSLALAPLPIVEVTARPVAGDRQRGRYFVSLTSAIRLTSTTTTPEQLQNAEREGQFIRPDDAKKQQLDR